MSTRASSPYSTLKDLCKQDESVVKDTATLDSLCLNGRAEFNAETDGSVKWPQPITENYRYHLSPTGYGSQRYGNCQVCGQHCDSVYIQSEEREYKLPAPIAQERGVDTGWTRHNCSSYFGHKDCLISRRRSGSVEVHHV